MMWNSMVWLLIECDGAENWNWIFKNDYNGDGSNENRRKFVLRMLFSLRFGPFSFLTATQELMNEWMNGDIHDERSHQQWIHAYMHKHTRLWKMKAEIIKLERQRRWKNEQSDDNEICFNLQTIFLPSRKLKLQNKQLNTLLKWRHTEPTTKINYTNNARWQMRFNVCMLHTKLSIDSRIIQSWFYGKRLIARATQAHQHAHARTPWNV